MTVVQYFDDKPWESSRVDNPSWEQTREAIIRMDKYYYPIVQLSCCKLENKEDGFSDENSFNIIGGAGQIALFHYMGEWQYERNSGGEEEVRLWDSGQGYFCQEKNIIYELPQVLSVVKVFYEYGDYQALEELQT